MTTSDQNKAVVRRCFEIGASGNFEALHQIIGADYVLHPEGIRGVDGLREMVEGYRAALPDLRVTIDHQFTEGDYVATRYTITGTHEGELMGVAPTGKEVAFIGLTISRCRNGTLLEEWELADVTGLLRQVGALPEPAQA